MKILPGSKIESMGDIGRLVREKRKKDGLTQLDVAAVCGLGNRFMHDLEKGRPVRFDLALEVLKSLGLEVYVIRRGWHDEAEN